MSLFFLIAILFIMACYEGFGRLSRKMPANSPASRAARLQRIQNAGFWLQLAVGLFWVVGIYSVLAFLCGWPFFSQSPARMVVSQHHIYTSPADMPGNILTLALLKTAVDFAAGAVMFALLGLYRRGILFSARNVLYIRLQGYYLIIGFLLDDQLQTALSDVQLSTTPFFIGLIIIFVSWIMDEGRKIQEEQELTV
jgi:hypothetical protein